MGYQKGTITNRKASLTVLSDNPAEKLSLPEIPCEIETDESKGEAYVPKPVNDVAEALAHSYNKKIEIVVTTTYIVIPETPEVKKK